MRIMKCKLVEVPVSNFNEICWIDGIARLWNSLFMTLCKLSSNMDQSALWGTWDASL
jgi:hypothetical protein